jgi:hypothetical protein
MHGRRWLISLDADGAEHVKAVPDGWLFQSPENLPGYLADAHGLDDDLLARIAAACHDRLGIRRAGAKARHFLPPAPGGVQ